MKYAELKIIKYSSSKFKVNKVLRQGDATAPLLFNVVLEIAFRRSEVETQGTVFDRCSQMMACIDGVVL
jgi:hypothetical protein